MLVGEAPIQSIENCHSSLLVQLKLVLFIRKVQGCIGWYFSTHYGFPGGKKIAGYAGCKNVYVVSFLGHLSQTSRLLMVPSGCRDPAQNHCCIAYPRRISECDNRSEKEIFLV